MDVSQHTIKPAMHSSAALTVARRKEAEAWK
jgi:hypothetical protein